MSTESIMPASFWWRTSREYEGLEKHHIFGASNRNNSEKYGLFVYITPEIHRGTNGVHNNKALMDEWHEIGQRAFEEHYPDLDFIKIFGKNYL